MAITSICMYLKYNLFTNLLIVEFQSARTSLEIHKVQYSIDKSKSKFQDPKPKPSLSHLKSDLECSDKSGLDPLPFNA